MNGSLHQREMLDSSRQLDTFACYLMHCPLSRPWRSQKNQISLFSSSFNHVRGYLQPMPSQLFVDWGCWLVVYRCLCSCRNNNSAQCLPALQILPKLKSWDCYSQCPLRVTRSCADLGRKLLFRRECCKAMWGIVDQEPLSLSKQNPFLDLRDPWSQTCSFSTAFFRSLPQRLPQFRCHFTSVNMHCTYEPLNNSWRVSQKIQFPRVRHGTISSKLSLLACTADEFSHDTTA